VHAHPGLGALSVWEGIRVGADRTLPGALARHTNALAVAISCLSYGHCHGYTSLRSVSQALYDGGLSYEMYGRNLSQDAKRRFGLE
jgi:hypothetical protein